MKQEISRNIHNTPDHKKRDPERTNSAYKENKHRDIFINTCWGNRIVMVSETQVSLP